MATAVSFTKDAAPSAADGPPVRKKLKTSDLPLASATRGAIDALALAFKKKGNYDSLRKQAWEALERSDFEAEFTRDLLAVAEAEIDAHPSELLKLDRSKATLLIEGAIDRAGVYQSAEARIDALIDAHIEEIEAGVRRLRKDDIGEEAANAEQAKGAKTDEQYAQEYAEKRQARENVRREAREKEQAIADEKKKVERAKRKEEEAQIEAEREKRRTEREARRKAEREREEEKEKELREREREREKVRERERDRGRDRDRDDRYSSRRYEHSSSRRGSVKDAGDTAKVEQPKEDPDLDQEALDVLLRSSKNTNRRARHQLEAEIDETLVPPPRKAMPASAIKPIPRDSPSAKLEVKKSSAPTKPKADDSGFKTPLKPGEDGRDGHSRKESRRSRSRDHESVRRTSRSRSARRHDSRERGSVRSRRDSRDRDTRSRKDSRDRDDRRRRDSRDRDDRHSRRDSRDRDDKRRYRSRSRSRDRRRSYRDRSRSRIVERRHRVHSPAIRDMSSIEAKEAWKQAEVKKREAEAKAYLAAQQEAREKGLPIPGWTDRQPASTPRNRERDDHHASSPTSTRKRESSRDRDRDQRSSRARTRSRSPTGRRGSRIERSTSPINIDRYVPGASARRTSTTTRSPYRKRDRSRSRSRSRSRDRDRDRDRENRRERRRSRDEKHRRKSRSRSRSRSRRRDRSRDRDGTKARSRSRSRSRSRNESRSRSPLMRREKEARRDRSRSRNREKEKEKERDRDRDRDRRRDRSRSRSRSRDRDREKESHSHRERDRERKRSRSRGSKRDSRRE